MNTIEDKINLNKPSFTESDEIISKAIQDYPGIIERYTVSQLADFLKLSTASIMRFAKKIGYSGYSEMRFDYMRYVHGQLKELTPNNILNQYVTQITESFQKFTSLDEEIFMGLATQIKAHKHVIALGSGKSGLACEYLKFSLLRAGKCIDTATDTVVIHDLPKASKSSDLYLFFTEKANSASSLLPGFIKDIRQTSKAEIIIITCNPKSPFESKVSKTIVLPSINTNQEGIRSHALMLGFIDILSSYFIE